MKKNLFKLLKIIGLLLCVIFLVTACSSGEEGGTLRSGSDDSDTELAEQQKKCWQGDLLATFYENLGAMSISVYNKLTTEDLLNLMMLAFTLWMAFQILRHVSATSPESIGEFWTKVLRQGALCMICGFLASSSDNILYALNTFVFPIYLTLLEFCGDMLDVANASNPSSSGMLLPDGGSGQCHTFPSDIPLSCNIGDTSNISITSSGFPDEPQKLMSCMACSVGARLDVGYTVSMEVINKDSFVAFLIGCFLAIAFTIAKFGFVLYLVDSVFRLDMMIVIAPFLILFYAFEQTRKWTVVGFKIILNSAAIMLCLAVLVSTTIGAMQNVLANPAMGLNFGDSSEYENFGTVAITMVLLGIVIVKSSGIAVTLSESVTGGGGDTKFQKKMAALIGTIAKGLFVLITWGSGKAVTTVISYIERLKAIYDKVQKAKAKINKVRNKMNQMAGRR